ncbi:drug/metabolite transporter (DMT)-like permease [Kibdelosporangium banguiense]|uniref:Drug/metabolite transporter (DMT)-like permease n=1 Tax=Kibdelosporangium banguiense TaxID=1365924 RepID=A0ABS4T5I3_9PSEU|nr:EamA family transporter [Kibdelosporangium banguiense]MBP2319735.1 drug/metabolite transporter (DMT)-like permease [Kibdelosporangium banguiense]
MNPVAIGLVLVAALAHAAWNFSAKRASTGGALFVWLYQATSAVICLPVAVGALALSGATPQWSWLLAAGVSAVLHVAYGLVLQQGYAVGDMSVVYPVARGSGPLLSVIAAVAFLGERPGALALVGAACVVAGVLVVGLGGKTLQLGPSVFYGALTGLTIAAYTLWDAHSVNGFAVPPLIYFCTGAVIQSLILAPHAVRSRRRVAVLWREHRVDVLVIAVLSPLAYICVLYAMRIAPVSMVAPARELSIVFGSVIAWRFLREPDPVRRLTGAVIVLAGVAAIAAA